MALVFGVVHLYNIKLLFFHCFCGRNVPRYQYSLALCAFLTEGNTEGTNSLKALCLMFVYFCLFVCFVLCGFESGLILWFLDNLWFETCVQSK